MSKLLSRVLWPIFTVIFSMSVISCGGGGGGSDSPPSTPPVDEHGDGDGGNSGDEDDAPQSRIGIFLDSPVAGLAYTTTSGISGTTSASGEFEYEQGDMVTFSLGGIELPAVEGGDAITPLDIFETANIYDTRVINLARLLQSLDDDGEIETVISLSGNRLAALQDAGLTLDHLSISISELASEPAVVEFLQNVGAGSLVSWHDAAEHFSAELASSTIVDTDGDDASNALDSDDDNDGESDQTDDFPWDATEQRDLDADFIGDSADRDDDGDGIEDGSDSIARAVRSLNIDPNDIAASVYVPEHDRLFLSSTQNKNLHIISLSDDRTQKIISFEHMPERMALSGDGSTLYVALLTGPHDYYNNDEQSGYVAVVDVETLTLKRTIEIALDPYDLVVTDSGKLVVSSESEQRAEIVAYDVATGAELGRVSTWGRSTLSLHPSHDWVFAADAGVSPAKIEKYDISDDGIRLIGDSPYRSEYRVNGKLWATPDGRHVITKSGDVFRASDMAFVRSITAYGVSIVYASFYHAGETIILTLSNGETLLVNALSLEAIHQLAPFGSPKWNFLTHGYLYSVVESGGQLYIVKEANPCPACGSNAAPTASLHFAPAQGNTNTTYVFNADASSDAEDGNALEYRWDIDADGEWDTEFTTSSTFERRFILAGVHYVRLQVKDSGGMVDDQLREIDVAQGIDSGVVIDPAEGESMLISTTDSVADADRGKLYVTDQSAKRLYVIDLATGVTERRFDFINAPSEMAISPDGSSLYVALNLSGEDVLQDTGYVAVFDLAQQARVDTLQVPLAPYDIVATTSGKLVISPAGGQWSSIIAVDAETGEELGRTGIRHRSKLTLHPSEKWVFAADTDVSPSDFEKFDISGSGITALGDSPYHGDHRISGSVWATPDGRHLITRGGDVFLAGDMTYVRSLTGTSTIERLSFDVTQNIMAASLSDGNVLVINLGSLELIQTLSPPSGSIGLYLTPDAIYYLTRTDGVIDVVESAHPCPGCATNISPEASFTYAPTSVDTTDDVLFDASASSDAEDGYLLNYRWDLGADGTWDTGFRHEATFSHQYLIAGEKSVRLQVKDSSGDVDDVLVSLEIAPGTDTGITVDDSVANQLAFSATDLAFDSRRQKLFVTDREAKRLYLVDVTTGLTEKYFEFMHYPERMTLAPDGDYLYVAVPIQEHSPYWWTEDQTGYIAVFDLEQEARVNTLKVAIDPFDLVVTSDETLLVSSGSGQWTDIVVLNGSTGDELGRGRDYDQSMLALHPAETWVYSATNGLSPSDIQKFKITETGLASLGDSPYHGDHRMFGDVWVTPDGDHVITRGGDVFLATDMTYVTGLTATGVRIESLAFDEAASRVLLIGSDGYIYEYELSTWAQSGVVTTVAQPRSIFIGTDAYVVSEKQGWLELESVTFE